MSAILVPQFAIGQNKVIDSQARAIEVRNDSAMMRYQADYWITVVSGSVGKDGIPRIIRVGEAITVANRTLVANYIFTHECLERITWNGEVLCERGQIYCIVVERPEDVPTDVERDRLWINVKDCRPLTTASIARESGTVEVLKASEYIALPEDQQVPYVAGLVDGMAYVLSNYDILDHGEWIACIRRGPLGHLLKDVNSQLKADPEYQKYPVSHSLAKAIGKRRPCRN